MKRKSKLHRSSARRGHPARPVSAAAAGWVPLGALAAGFGLALPPALAQTTTDAPPVSAAREAAPASAVGATAVLPEVKVRAKAEHVPDSKQNYQAVQTTAGKGRQALRDIPQSVTVVTEKLMDDKNYDTLKAAMHTVSGIAFEAGEGGAIGDLIRLRGFTTRGDIFQDGMRDIAQYNRDTFNQDRIEVLRGSASMLYGRGSTGGIINQVAKQPYLFDRHEVELTVGTDDYYRLTGDFNLKTGENAALRVNVMKTDAHSTRNGPQTHRQGLAPTYSWGIGTAHEFTVSYYHLSYNDIPDYGFRYLNGRPVDAAAERSFNTESDYQDDSANYLHLTHTYRLVGGGELKTQFRDGRYNRDLWATIGAFGSPAPTTLAQVNDSRRVTRSVGPTRGAKDHHTFLQTDFNGQADWFGLRHDLLAGAELARERSDAFGYATTGISKADTTFGNPGTAAAPADTRVKQPANSFKSTTLGAYAQDTLNLTAHWKLLAGLRFDRFDGAYNSYSATTQTYSEFSRVDEVLSQRWGVLYQPDMQSSYYASYGTSFNASGDLYQFDSGTAETPPEKSRNFEVGAKWELLDGDLSMRTALFRTEKTNERNTDRDQASGAFLLSGKRHTHGIEFEAAGRIGSRIEIFGGLALMRGKIDQAGSAANAQATVGRESGLTPKVTANIWATYRLDEHWRFGLGADGMSGRIPASAEAPNNQGIVTRAPGYAKVDALVEYEHSGYKVKLNLINLLDKVYVDGVYRGFTVWGPTRSAQLSVSTRF